MKQRSKKAAQKRFHISAKGKVQHLAIGQAHFNSRADGNTTRQKHVRGGLSGSDRGRLDQLIPYNLQ